MTPKDTDKDPAKSAGKGQTMREPAPLGKPDTHAPGKKPDPKRTIGNHPADPNSAGADWNLLPPGISDEDVKNPGGMTESGKKKPR